MSGCGSGTTDLTRVASAEISVLLRRECGRWVAQGLEFDVVGAGDTVEDAEYELQRMLAAQVVLNLDDGRGAFDGLPPAPAFYWREFASAQLR